VGKLARVYFEIPTQGNRIFGLSDKVILITGAESGTAEGGDNWSDLLKVDSIHYHSIERRNKKK